MMIRKRTFPDKVACAVFAACAVFCAFAQEAADESAAPAAENATDEAKPAEAPAVQTGKEFRFMPLMRLKEVRGGNVEISSPDGGGWKAAVPGRYYPFGSEVRLAGDGSAEAFARFEIGTKASVTLSGNSSFATRDIAIGEKTRAVLLKSGTVGLDLPRSLKDGLITVVTPDFVCSNLAGESKFECTESADGREVVVRVVTGSLSLEGRHYKIVRMGAANQVRVCTSTDALLTSLRGESGDYKVSLDCGVKSVLDPETGASKDVPQTIEYGLSPKCAVKIWRKVSDKAAGGSGRMAVAVQTFDAQGRDKNFRTFFEARSNINSGELIVPPKDTSKEEAEKTESAATDVEEVSATDTASSAASSSESSSSESSSESAAPAQAPAADSGDGL